ncbi:GntR family transcriptional regulator [Solwaraspora sp. WMMD1047]|uniref:GntR family transcriptional regulator n=1 Tax=Solwaraspora sp. WMMD1047 TaxID=3016102 RepID=UPI002415B24C|nr:GntR family transcriptional regulator [Solwaraspora sp. WMMD1047]MDG4833269.1 GntR family transcriptional regulator [Solwaraspora sp. WMMD1047]
MTATKHEQLRSHLQNLIERQLAPHERLPTERDLAQEFGVSRMTVRQALERLENERLVYRVRGAGTFVARPAITKSIELTSFSDDMRRRGLQPGSHLRTAESVPAGASVGFALGLSPSHEVVHLERVRTADGVPMCVEHTYLSAAVVPGLLDQPFDGSLYDLLRDLYHIRLVRAEQSIRATVLEEETAGLLQVPPFSPALLVERTTYDQRDRPVERATSTYRGDRYAFQIEVVRPTNGTQ